MALKDIKEIDKNMKENTTEATVTDKWIDIDSNIINKYMLGKALKNGSFNRLNDVYVSDNVETLKLQPAGENICFKTNSKFIKIKASLAGAAYMSHMTAVGTIGFSLYVLNKNNEWRFLNCTKVNKAEYEVTLFNNINGTHDYRLYFPLYQVLNSVSIGIENNASLDFYKPELETMIIYGTSISQGGCASRPGNDYSALIGRMANLNVINLGFSGSCKVEPQVLDIINQVIDEQNVKYIYFELESNSPSSLHMVEHFSYYMENIHKKDELKIYLVSHYDESFSIVSEKEKKDRKNFRKTQKELCKKYNINYIDGIKLTKELDGDGTVDGAHLNDLGFWCVAKNFVKIIKSNVK